MTNAEELLTTAQVCQRLGVSKQRISRLVATARLFPAVRTPGGMMLFTPGEIDRFAKIPRRRGNPTFGAAT